MIFKQIIFNLIKSIGVNLFYYSARVPLSDQFGQPSVINGKPPSVDWKARCNFHSDRWPSSILHIVVWDRRQKVLETFHELVYLRKWYNAEINIISQNKFDIDLNIAKIIQYTMYLNCPCIQANRKKILKWTWSGFMLHQFWRKLCRWRAHRVSFQTTPFSSKLIQDKSSSYPFF